MKRSIEDTPIAIVGAGNLATNLTKAFYHKGFRIIQVYSRTEESARALAQTVESDYTTDFESFTKEAQLYIVALKDDAFLQVLPHLTNGREHALWVHTAGSLPMNVWEGYVPRYGVFYPLQTFSKQREVDFANIPFFIESNSEADTQFLCEVGGTLSKKVYKVTSDQRKALHLAAVFACNFTDVADLSARFAIERCLVGNQIKLTVFNGLNFMSVLNQSHDLSVGFGGRIS